MNWFSIGSNNGLLPVRCQAITWTNADILYTGPLGTNFSEIWIKIKNFSLKKMHLKLSSVKFRPFCPGLIVLSDFCLQVGRRIHHDLPYTADLAHILYKDISQVIAVVATRSCSRSMGVCCGQRTLSSSWEPGYWGHKSRQGQLSAALRLQMTWWYIVCI